ncbi:competence protein ComK [Peribacillus sp. FSL H8-0477]|uniref:competence protein ComK n=1 Tax=Peribacillus sp. FSL H8-0477 TaxID=2921388 RepID=UPI0030F74F3C
MIIKTKYIIFHETISLETVFNESAYELTKVRQGEQIFLVRKTVSQVIDDSLTYYFSNRPGAVNGAKSIVGQKYHIPIVLNAEMILILVPFGGPTKKDTIWIVNNHIREHCKLTAKETFISTSYGYKILIPLSVAQVEDRMGIAARVHLRAITTRSRQMNFLFDPNCDIIETTETETKIYRLEDPVKKN